jgi:hypothetical protein
VCRHRIDPYYDPREDVSKYKSTNTKPNGVDGLVIWHSLNKMLDNGQGADELVNGAPRFIYYYSQGNGISGDAVYHYADETTLSKTYRADGDFRFLNHAPGHCNENLANYNLFDALSTPVNMGCEEADIDNRVYPCGLSPCNTTSICTSSDPCSFDLVADPYETSVGRAYNTSATFMNMATYATHLPGANMVAQNHADFPWESWVSASTLKDEWCDSRLQYTNYINIVSTPDVLTNTDRALAHTSTDLDFETYSGVFMEGELLSKSTNQDVNTCRATCLADDHCAGFTRVTPTTGAICFFWRVQPGQQEQSIHAYYGSAFGSYYASPNSYVRLERFPMPPPPPLPPPPSPSPPPAPPPPPSPPPPSPSPPSPSPPPPSPSP